MKPVVSLSVVVLVIFGCAGGDESAPASTPPSAPAATAGASSPVAPSVPTERTPPPTAPAASVFGAATYLGFPPDLWFVAAVAMRVDVAELNIRSAPSTAASSLGLVRKGDVLIVQDAPVVADGHRWFYGYNAIPEKGELPALPDPIPPSIDPPQGWFATPTEAAAYLVPLEYRCSAQPDLAAVSAMLDSERVPCLGSRLLTLEGSLACIDCGGVGPVWEPGWLAHSFRDPVVRSGNSELQLYFPPSVEGADAVGNFVRVAGNFDDPRSSSCRISLEGDQGQVIRLPDTVAIEYCRRHFVVESMSIVGPDPSYVGI